jgi:hypothetical protein
MQGKAPFRKEQVFQSLRTTVMRSRVRLIVAVILLLPSGSICGQESGSTSAPSASGSPLTAQSGPQPVVLKPDASGAVPIEQIRELLRRAEEKDMENDRQQRDYTYTEREERHSLGNNGEIKKVESRSSEILEIYGEPVGRLTARDDKPLSADESKKEDEKIQKIIDKRKNESEGDRRKRLAREEKDREEDRKFVLEVADAFNFQLVGSETLDGHDTWVLEGQPRPSFQPKSREAQMLSKFKGRVWIDKTEDQWVKLDITAIDTISVGFVLARIHKGTHIVIELTRVNNEVWLPKHVQFHLDIRVALFKNYNEDIEQSYRDFKKFRTHSTMTVIGEQP